MTGSQYATARVTRFRAAKHAISEGRARRGETRHEGADPALTGGERRSGMFEPCCGDRRCAYHLSTEPVDGLRGGKGRLSR